MKFSKMHGAGNDFSLFDGFSQVLPDYALLAKAVCDRHFGTGGDGIMVALPSEEAQVKMVYYNADGSKGEMCGNGIRCFARFVYEKGMVDQKEFTVETEAGIKKISLDTDEAGRILKVRVGMGRPLLAAAEVPTTLAGDPVTLAPLDLGQGQLVLVTALRMGVPHVVVVVEDIEKVDLLELGPRIESHIAFPERANANFMEVVDRRRVKVKTYERGAGHTLACGTGCCASVVAGNLLGILDDQVTVQVEGGCLEVGLAADGEVTLAGPAEFVCDGEYKEWIKEVICRSGQ